MEVLGIPGEARGVGEALTALVGRLDPAALPPSGAMAVYRELDRIERLAAAGKTLLAGRIAESGAWRHRGHKTAAELLAAETGTDVAAAVRQIDTSRRLGELPVVEDAARRGALSARQTEAIADAGAVNAAATGELVDAAAKVPLGQLRDDCRRAKRAADPDPDATHERIRRGRRGVTYTDSEGGWNLVARGPAEAGAALEAALSPIVEDLFHTARRAGRPEPREAYVFDALVGLARRATNGGNGNGGNGHGGNGNGGAPAPRREAIRHLALIHVDHAALVRGEVEGEERCEIVGIGSVPVRVARELLGESLLKLIVTRGRAANVTHLGRGPTTAQRFGLLWFQPWCANEACRHRAREYDHRVDWAQCGETDWHNIDGLCDHDHYLKTHQGWALVDGTGRRAFVPSDDPRHPRHKPPPERPGRERSLDADDP